MAGAQTDVIIGVLALQGAFLEHIHYLQSLPHAVHAVPVRTPAELARCHALVLPGGESTVIAHVAARTPGLLAALAAFAADPHKAVWGTCAGMILMADSDGVGGGKKRAVRGWGGIRGLKVWRNLYGGQLESFEAPLVIPALSDPTRPFNALFIRAPAVHRLDPPPDGTPAVQVLATLPSDLVPPPPPSDSSLGHPHSADLAKVMLRQGKKMVTSFHPELSGDARIHEYWVEKCVLGR